MADEKPFTLEQLCRALAAHCLLTNHMDWLNGFFAPETAEATAEVILQFARGESMSRPKPKSEEDVQA
jgi:hypothetical protein